MTTVLKKGLECQYLLIGKQTRGTAVAAPFYLWFGKERCHFSTK